MNNPETAVYKFIADNNILNSGESVLIAFSGGYDSTCLLHILSKIPDIKLTAIHLNHNWRGKESKTEEENCKILCKKLNIPFYSETLSDKIPKTETAARVARYDFFERCSKKFNSKIIFTAHNADDNAETVLYRIAKGTAIDGLIGIASIRDIFYRPLLNVKRIDIEKYCQVNSLKPNNDSSNSDTKYKRNLIRHKIIPVLKSINPEIIDAINSLSQLAEADTTYLNKLATEINNDTKLFLKSDKVIQSRVIKKLLTENNIDYDRDKIELIKEFINDASKSKSGKTYTLNEKINLYVNNQNFYTIKNESNNQYEELKIEKEGSYKIGNHIFSIEKCKTTPPKYPPDKERIAYINIPEINFTLRYRCEGDYIYPIGLDGHRQKLKKYLNEKKIPKHEKNDIILLCKGNEVMWAAGYGLSEKIKVKTKATHILKLYERDFEDE